MSETKVVSFVLRFVQEEDDAPQPEPPLNVHPWRGVVRHVQSREEMQFTELKEALVFMGRFVELRTADDGRRTADE